jgi:regulator of protease activity HflC (stomatin/prohibitin superfamily)
MIVILLIPVFLTIAVGSIVLAIYYLAETFKVPITMPQEGTAEAIVSGNSDPRFIMPFRGHYLNIPGKPGYQHNQPTWEVLDDPDGLHADKPRFWGMYWVGLPPGHKVYRYRFQWSEWGQPAQETVYRAWGRDRLTYFIYIKEFTYYSKVRAKTNSKHATELIPVDVEYIFTVRCNNPFVALFVVEDWLAKVQAILDNGTRNYIGVRSYEDLASEYDREQSAPVKPSGSVTESDVKLEMIPDSLSKHLQSLNEKMPDDEVPLLGSASARKGLGLKRNCGITLVHAEIVSVELPGDAEKEVIKATTAEYVAKKEGIAKLITAQANREARNKATQADVYHILQTNRALERFGQTALAYKYLETLGQAGEGGNTIIVTSNSSDVSTDSLVRAGLERQARKPERIAPAKKGKTT